MFYFLGTPSIGKMKKKSKKNQSILEPHSNVLPGVSGGLNNLHKTFCLGRIIKRFQHILDRHVSPCSVFCFQISSATLEDHTNNLSVRMGDGGLLKTLRREWHTGSMMDFGNFSLRQLSGLGDLFSHVISVTNLHLWSQGRQ